MQVQRASEMAASMVTASAGPSATASHLEAAMKRLDMDNYDNDEDTLVNRVLQVCSSRKPIASEGLDIAWPH